MLETFVDERRSGIIRDGGRGRFHMRNEVRTAFFTGFRQMDLISHPGGAALFAVMRFDIVG